METRRVAESVGISKATLTGVVKTLADRGWIIRIPGTEDRRLVSLELTDAGRALLDQLYPEFNKVESAIVSGFAPDELADLIYSLRRFVTEVEALEAAGT